MDKRGLVILMIILSELVLRLVYTHLLLPADPLFGTAAAKLFYTAAARLLQTGLILFLAFDLCGIRTAAPGREILIGAGVAAAFGAAVLLSDLAGRLLLQGGWLELVLARQSVTDPLLFFLVGCVLGPFAEELFFRGLLYSWLREGMPAVLAVALSSLLFAGVHQGFFVQLAGGLLFGVVFEWRKNIWAAFVVHAAANFGIWIVPWIHPFW